MTTTHDTDEMEEMERLTTPQSWRHEHETVKPQLTEHAQIRYDQRTPSWSCSPEYAYDHSIETKHLPMESIEDDDGEHPDNIHYYCEWFCDDIQRYTGEYYETFLLERDDAVVTVYRRRYIAKDMILDGYCDGLFNHFMRNHAPQGAFETYLRIRAFNRRREVDTISEQQIDTTNDSDIDIDIDRLCAYCKQRKQVGEQRQRGYGAIGWNAYTRAFEEIIEQLQRHDIDIEQRADNYEQQQSK